MVLPFDVSPLLNAVEEHVKEMVASERKADVEHYKGLISDIIKEQFSEQSPEYQKLMTEVNEKLADIQTMANKIKSAQVPFPNEIELKQPKWYLPFSDSKILNSLGTLTAGLKGLAEHIFKVEIRASTKSPVPVVLIDPKTGQPYKAKGGGSGGSPGAGTAILDGYQTITPFNGQITTAGTKVQISSTSVRCKKVVIQAGSNVGGYICVGNTDVSAANRTGMILYANQAWTFEVDDVSKLYIDTDTNLKKFNGYYVN